MPADAPTTVPNNSHSAEFQKTFPTRLRAVPRLSRAMYLAVEPYNERLHYCYLWLPKKKIRPISLSICRPFLGLSDRSLQNYEWLFVKLYE